MDRLVTVIQNPLQFKIPAWFLNRQRDIKTGKTFQLSSNQLEATFREDLVRMVKMRYVFCDDYFVLTKQPSPWSSPPVGLARTWPAHQDNWSPWSHCGCVEEEGTVNYLIATFFTGSYVYDRFLALWSLFHSSSSFHARWRERCSARVHPSMRTCRSSGLVLAVN